MIYSKHFYRYPDETNDNFLSDKLLTNKLLQIDTD